MTAQLSLRTLGGFALHVGGNQQCRPHTQKARALMAFLAMHHDVDIARERLIELFWPESEIERARDSLKTALCSIRQCLRSVGLEPEAYFSATKSVVRWTYACADVSEFEALCETDDFYNARQAMQLYRGDFLEGDYGNWAIAERERLALMYEGVLGRVVKRSKDSFLAQKLIALNPFHEDAYATMIEAALADRQRTLALCWVRRYRQALAEIGEQPSPAFESRFGRIDLVTPFRLQLAAAV